ncbi:hypothetical protein Ancab_034380 [Ancistrocladus abbreviatus]
MAATDLPTTTTVFSLLILFLSLQTAAAAAAADHPSPYLSPTTLFQNYQKMLNNFKIFIYPQNTPVNFTNPILNLFYGSLLSSPFRTSDPEEAHLFFVPFPPNQSPRSLARLIADLRATYPYWQRTLGADHFYLSCEGVRPSSSRNVVELKKNAVQISCLPSRSGAFIPHKDITFPPLIHAPPHLLPPKEKISRTLKYVGYYRSSSSSTAGWGIIGSLISDSEFLIESEPSDQWTQVRRVESSKFCLFTYDGTLSGVGEALKYGCVPVVITDRPIQDLPFMDLLRWQDLALFVGSSNGDEELKHVLHDTSEERYERMRGLGMTAAQHFVWNASPQPLDAFHMLMYQLWFRRHAIRYARWEGGSRQFSED